MPVRVIFPGNNREERTYITELLLGDFLGLDFSVESSDSEQHYRLILENNNEIVIQDHFFSHFPGDLEYLHSGNIPGNVISAKKNQFIPEEDLPIIYGKDFLQVTRGEQNEIKIECGIDLFASSYFMVTRWEEYTGCPKDKWGRVSASHSLAFQHHFLQRPVVNEYTELLWNMLSHAGIRQPRKSREYAPYVTHDVDFLLRWKSLLNLFRALGSDLMKEHKPGSLNRDFRDYILTQRKQKKDPFDTFEFLMSASESYGRHSYFFLMSVPFQRRWYHYGLRSAFLNDLISVISERGHRIGFHPGHGTHTDPNRWKREYNRLQASTQYEIQCGRQHFLQFEAPSTWQIWNDMGMEWDSTLAYNDKNGFRAGCCYGYPPFNFLTRKKLRLMERPLTIMDISMMPEPNTVHSGTVDTESKGLVDKVKKYRGDAVLLWHNSQFFLSKWKPVENLYQSLLDYVCREN